MPGPLSATGTTCALIMKPSRYRSCFRSCCVPHKGAILLLIWTALLHSVSIYGYYLVMYIRDAHSILGIVLVVIVIARALTYLLYPVAGLLGELYWSRYKVMITGNVLAVLGTIALMIALIIYQIYTTNSDSYVIILVTIAASIGIILYQFGLGLFEANAIQFGVDQLQFASNDEISKFVNWYYWALNILQLIPPAFIIKKFNYHVLFIGFGLLVVVCGLFCTCCKRHYVREPIRRRVNPITHIFKVLRYARRHTVPVLRSAFTYGEGPPSRLDLAKERYGGPYTTEEVEDVKSFGRILLVLLSLFGIQLVSPVSYFYTDLSYFCLTHCNEFVQFSVFANGNTIWYLVILIIIPIYMIVIRLHFQRYVPNMLKRMGVSLILVIVSLALSTVADVTIHNSGSTTNDTYIDIIIPFGVMAETTGALGHLLNFLTALKFILAQSPCNMLGLLIGIWYAHQAVAESVQLATFVMFDQTQYGYLFSVVKLLLAITSFIIYIIVSYCYRYRKRNESSDINEWHIIEEYTERQLLHEQVITDNSYALIIEDSL